MNAFYVIKQFGGTVPLAKATGLHRSTVWRWTQPRENNGTDGIVPTINIPIVLKAAKINKINLNVKKLMSFDDEIIDRH